MQKKEGSPSFFLPPNVCGHIQCMRGKPLLTTLNLIMLLFCVGIIFFVIFWTGRSASSELVSETTTELQTETASLQTAASDTAAATSAKLTDVSDIVAGVMPSVVAVASVLDERTESFASTNVGSGTIIAQTGSDILILTCYHVVDDGTQVYITFNDGNMLTGHVKAYSEAADLAIVVVLNVNAHQVDYSIAGLCTEEVDVGDGVIVIGNALGYGQSVVTGVISAADRNVEINGYAITLLQTDAAINGGNSGGCVLNREGGVIGVSEAKVTETDVEGIAFVNPIYDNYELILDLLNI